MNKRKNAGRTQNRDPTEMKQTAVFFLGMFIKMSLLFFLFYRNFPLAVSLGTAMGIYGIGKGRQESRRRKQKQMNLELREGLQGIAAALHAGYSVENAFFEAEKDLRLLYGNGSVLAPEIREIAGKLQLNCPIEEALFALAERSGLEDVRRFAEVFQTAKRTGGDLIAITKTSADRISEKIEVKREIETMIAGKSMEAKIMNAIPLGIILYFWLCSPGFFDCLYQAEGRIVMTVLLLLYLLAHHLGERIMRIDV